LADDKTAACLSVSPYRRLLRSAILYTKKLPCLHMTVFSDRQFTVRGMLIVLCELEFSEFTFDIIFIV